MSAKGGVLVGKDGEVKYRKPSPVTVREVIRLIDRMPLRRQVRKSASERALSTLFATMTVAYMASLSMVRLAGSVPMPLSSLVPMDGVRLLRVGLGRAFN